MRTVIVIVTDIAIIAVTAMLTISLVASFRLNVGIPARFITPGRFV